MPARCPRCGKVISAVLGYCTECRDTAGPRRLTDEDRRRLSKVPTGHDPRRSPDAYRTRTYVLNETPSWKSIVRWVGAALFIALGAWIMVGALLVLLFTSYADVHYIVLVVGLLTLLIAINTLVAGVNAIKGSNKWHFIMASGVLLVLTALMLLGGAIWEGLLYLVLTVAGAVMVLEGWPMSSYLPGVSPSVRHGTSRAR